MKTWLADLPVQRKLGYAMLFTSTVASILACGVFLVVEYIGDRGNLEQTISTLARITANNSSAAIAFDDRAAVRQNLEALRAEPQIIAAVIYDADGQVFARYNTHAEEVLPSRAADAPGLRFDSGRLIVVQPVMEGNRRLGVLHLQATMGQIYARMRTYSFIILGVLASTFGFVGLIASVLRRTLARPILELANTANAISAGQDYSLRAQQHGRDELGQLTVTFNAMLEQTQRAVGGLRESEWSHRQLVRALPAAACMCDARGLITLFNDEAVKLWGRTPELGREYFCGSHRIFRPDGTPLPLEQYPVAVALREGRAQRGQEIIIERPDGTRRNVMPHPEPIRDTTGRLVAIVNMLVDITEEKQATASIRQLAAIVESSDDAIIGRDLEGRITAWNRGAERLYGYSSEEMIGQPVTLLIPPDRLDEEPNIIRRIRNNEHIDHFETVRCRRDGTRLDVSLTVSPIKDRDGRIVGASKTARDITERVRLQQQAEFLGGLNAWLVTLPGPDQIMRVAARLIGEFLKVDRCYFCSFSRDRLAVSVKEDWAREGFSSISGVHRAQDFGTPEMWRAMAAGPVSIPDKSTHELTRNQGAGYAAVRIAAHATVPLVGENGELLAMLAVATEYPRYWRKDELAFLENVLGRVWPMIERARAQLELQASELRQREAAERMNLAIASANLGDWNWDATTDIMVCSPRTKELYGIAEDALLTRTAMRELLHPDDRELARQELRRSVETRTDYDTEYRVIRADGTLRWIAAKGRSTFDDAGKLTGMVGVVQDVTERRQHAEALKKLADKIESQALLFDATLSNITDLAYYFDLQGRWIYANRRLLDIWGKTLEEITGKSCLELGYSPELAARLEAQVQEAIKTKAPVRGETVYTSAAGKTDDHEYIFNPVLDAQGNVTAVVGTTRLITERKRAEETLRRSEAQLRLVTDNAPVLLVRVDREHRFTFVNRAYAERNAMKVSEIIGMKVVDVISPRAYEAIRHQMDEALEGARVEFELQVPYERLGLHWIHVIYVPERDVEGRIIGLLGVITDIDERKESENALKRVRDEALAASRAKDDFLAALSHELRTPLNPVLLLASDAAANPDLPPAIRADFDLILKNVHLEARLIDDLLDLTRITRGKLHLELRRCNVHNILEDALANVEADLKEKHLQLETDFAASTSRIKGDSVRLQQVFWNLLKNAVKFTPVNGKISVKSSLTKDGNTLKIRVEDNGIGMTPDEIGRIFQAFSQGDHAQAGTGIHRFGGLGLGLAITKMLVELHEGKIRAFSDGRDRGAVFEVELPISREAGGTNPADHSQPPVAIPVAAAERKDGAAVRHRILLVEDHAPTRMTLQHLLTHRKYAVVAAESATKAADLARTQKFDLVVSDVGLPDRSGYELMAELRALDPNLPGIALSGYGMEDDIQRSRAAGFAAHLVKPVTIGMLEDAIAKLPNPSRP